MVNVLCVDAGGFSAWYNPIWYSPDYMPTVPADLTKIREAFEKAVVRTHTLLSLPYLIASEWGCTCSPVSYPSLSCDLGRSGVVHGWKTHHIIASILVDVCLCGAGASHDE
jgi:hypothetical protein